MHISRQSSLAKKQSRSRLNSLEFLYLYALQFEGLDYDAVLDVGSNAEPRPKFVPNVVDRIGLFTEIATCGKGGFPWHGGS